MLLQEMEESDAGQDTGDIHCSSLSDEAAHARETSVGFSHALESRTAHQAFGPSSGCSIAAEAGSMQRHFSALLPERPCSRPVLARGASPEEVNRSLYQYAALALQQPAALARERKGANEHDALSAGERRTALYGHPP